MVYAPEDIDAEEILHRKLKHPNNNLTKYLAKLIKDAAENLFTRKKENKEESMPEEIDTSLCEFLDNEIKKASWRLTRKERLLNYAKEHPPKLFCNIDKTNLDKNLDEQSQNVCDDSQLDAVHNIFLSAWQTISDHKNPNGKAENNFPAIAKEWTFTLKEYDVLKEDKEITPSMVTDLMIKLKMVRQATGIDLDDNYQDLIGYAGWGHALANFKKN